MKTPILTIILALFFSGCSLLSSDDVDFGVCDAELFEELEETGYVLLFIRYDMPWTREDELEEEEVEAQQKAIADMHEEMLTALDERNLKYGGVRKMISTPRLALNAHDEETLLYICNHKMVEEVRERITGTIN